MLTLPVGFAITEIVINDPKELTVYFAGTAGRHIRDTYMSMQCEAIGENGRVVQRAMFPEITSTSSSYTFHSTTGLLSSTQFTQPALALMERAIFEDLRSRELISSNLTFAGHSLGEFSALGSIAEIMPIERLISVVFFRGLTMQMAVGRDDAGRSNFSMCAVNPALVSKCENTLQP